MNTSEQVGFSLVLGVGRIDNNNYMDIYTTAIHDSSEIRLWWRDFVNLLDVTCFKMQYLRAKNARNVPDSLAELNSCFMNMVFIGIRFHNRMKYKG